MLSMISPTTLRMLVGTAGTIVCAGLCLAGAAAPAAAAPADAPRVARVIVADLDLASSDGRASAEHRLRAAARAVCRVDTMELRAVAEAAHCRDVAIADARAQLALRSAVASKD